MFWLAKFFTKGKSVKDAIAYFFKLNNRMPNNIEIIKIKNAFMDQTRKSNVIDITSRIKDDWWKQRPGFKRQHPEVTKKIKESDDLVDSMTQAVMRFRQGGLIPHPEDYKDEKIIKTKKVYY